MWRHGRLLSNRCPALVKADGSNQQSNHVQAAAKTWGFVQTDIGPSLCLVQPKSLVPGQAGLSFVSLFSFQAKHAKSIF